MKNLKTYPITFISPLEIIRNIPIRPSVKKNNRILECLYKVVLIKNQNNYGTDNLYFKIKSFLKSSIKSFDYRIKKSEAPVVTKGFSFR